MFRHMGVLVFVLKDVFTVAEHIQPSPEPIYGFPVLQDEFRITNGMAGIRSVGSLSPPGRLGMRQTTVCPTGTIQACTNLTAPCCDAFYPICCQSTGICCPANTFCIQTTNPRTACCAIGNVECPGAPDGCCPSGNTCCGQYCCPATWTCGTDSSGVIGCQNVVASILSEKAALSSASSLSESIKSASIASESSAESSRKSAEEAKKKQETTIGIAVGVSAGTTALFALLSLGICLYKRNKKRKAAQGVPNNQNQSIISSQAPLPSQLVFPNSLSFSQQYNQVPAIVPSWATAKPSVPTTGPINPNPRSPAPSSPRPPTYASTTPPPYHI